MAVITLVVTALPKHLYLCVSLIPSVQPSGNPCKRSHSVGVSLLIVLSNVGVLVLILLCSVPIW